MQRDLILYFVLGGIAVALVILFLNHGGSVGGFSDEEFGSLTYLVILGVAIGSGVLLSMRHRLGEMFRNIVIWVGVFVLVIGAYAFQPEFNALKNRFYAVLMPGNLVSVESSKGQQRYMATRAADGHFYLNGEIDGAATAFIVDTGASVVAMDSEMARSLGIDVSQLRFTNRVMTANGVARAAPVRLDTVTIGDITRRNVLGAVTEGSGLGTVLLGMSFLDTLTSYDFRGDRLILTD